MNLEQPIALHPEMSPPAPPTNGDYPTEAALAPRVSAAVHQRLQSLGDIDAHTLPPKIGGSAKMWLFGVCIVAAVGLAGGAAWYTLGSFEDPYKDLQLQKAERGRLILSIVEKGELEAAKNTDLNCLVRASGRGNSVASSIKWLIDDGSRVKKGDVLIRLDDSALKEQLKNQEIVVAEKESLLTQAETEKETTISQNRSNLQTAENDLQLAQIDLEKYKEGELKQKQKDVEGRIILGESDLLQWNEKVVYSEKMVKKGYLSKSQAEADEAKQRSAQINLDKLNEEKRVLNNYDRQRTILDLENKLAQAREKLAVARIESRGKEAQSEANYKSKLSVLETEQTKRVGLIEDIRNCTIVAPNDGMVVYYIPESSRYGSSSGMQSSVIALGEPVRENQRMMRIPDLRHMQVKVKVHESLVPRLTADTMRRTFFGEVLTATLAASMRGPDAITAMMFGPQIREPFEDYEEEIVEYGLPAKIRIPSIEKPLDGHISTVSAVASSTDFMSADVKVYPTIVTIDTPGLNLKPGMTAEVTILVEELDKVLRLPVHSVLEVNGKRFCYVKTENGIEKRALITGLNNNKFLEIKDGSDLTEGDLVVQNPRQLAEERGDLQSEVQDPGEGIKSSGKAKSANGKGSEKAADSTEQANQVPAPKSEKAAGKGGQPRPGAQGAQKGNPEQRQQMMQQFMERFKTAKPQERKEMLEQIPESFRGRAKEYLKSQGIEVPE